MARVEKHIVQDISAQQEKETIASACGPKKKAQPVMWVYLSQLRKSERVNLSWN